MPKRSSKDTDPNVLAAHIVAQATEEEPEADQEPDKVALRSEAAKILGRLGGLNGGPARAKKLTKAQDVAGRLTRRVQLTTDGHKMYRSLRVTPAMEAGVSSTVWEVEDLVRLLEHAEETGEIWTGRNPITSN